MTACLAVFLVSNVIYRVLSIATCAIALGASAGLVLGGTLLVDHTILQIVRWQDGTHTYRPMGLPPLFWIFGCWLTMQFFPIPYIRYPVFVGPHNYAIWIVLGLVENACFLAASFISGNVEIKLLVTSAACGMITVISMVVGLAVIEPKCRHTFWQRHLLGDEMTRSWAVAHVETESERDLIRSQIFTDWAHFPKVLDPLMTNDWLKEGWPRWKATSPEWFTPDWIALANAHMDRVARTDLPQVPTLPPSLPSGKKSSPRGLAATVVV